jgi:beta-barrel assembly-enhancing protease
MRRRWTAISFPILAIGLLLGAAPARSDVKVGDVRAAQAKAGVPLREKPRTLAKRISTLPYGTRVKVAEVEGAFANVQVDGGGEGWVRAADLVEPTALTGPGAYGPQAARDVSSSDVTAAGRQLLEERHAGRQFDKKTENTYRRMNAGLDTAYPLVDRLETGAPSEADVLAFADEGKLGRGAVEEQAKWSKLRLTDAKADAGGTLSVWQASDAYIAQPTPTSDLEFVERLGQQFSPEQEYWLGRAVAAAAVSEHGLDPDPKRQALVQRIGASLALFSDQLRGTFGGWHFAVLRGAEPNGISGPGGFVFVTRGALDLARNEDEVAAILAHEMAHVWKKHGEQMIRRTKGFKDEIEKLKVLSRQAPPRGGDCNICGDVAKLLGDTSVDFVKTLDTSGYEKDFELEADWHGSLLLCEVGYRASALAEYLEVVPKREHARWTTHPSNDDRIEALRPIVYRHGCPAESDDGLQARIPRFKPFLVSQAPPPTPSGAAPAGPR